MKWQNKQVDTRHTRENVVTLIFTHAQENKQNTVARSEAGHELQLGLVDSTSRLDITCVAKPAIH